MRRWPNHELDRADPAQRVADPDRLASRRDPIGPAGVPDHDRRARHHGGGRRVHPARGAARRLQRSDALRRREARSGSRMPDVPRRRRGLRAPDAQLPPSGRNGDDRHRDERRTLHHAQAEPRVHPLRPQRLLHAPLPGGLPDAHRHPRVPRAHGQGPARRGRATGEGGPAVPVRARARLSRAMPGGLPSRARRRGDRHPPVPRLWRRALARDGGSPDAVPPGGRDRQAGGGHRRGSCGPHVRVLRRAQGPRGHGVRDGGEARRDAPLRHSGVPPPEGEAGQGAELRLAAPRHGVQGRDEARPGLHHRRPPGAGLRRDLPWHRRLVQQPAADPGRGSAGCHRGDQLPPAERLGRSGAGRAEEPRRRHGRRLHDVRLRAYLTPPRRGRHGRVPTVTQGDGRALHRGG